MKQFILPVIIAALISGVLGFYTGSTYQKNQFASVRNQFANGNFQDRTRIGGQPTDRNSGMGGRIFGEILSKDETSATVKLMDGSSKIVLLTDNTVYSKTQTGSAADLAIGIQVGVFGAVNQDGSITAQEMQINPTMRVNPNPTPEAR